LAWAVCSAPAFEEEEDAPELAALAALLAAELAPELTLLADEVPDPVVDDPAEVEEAALVAEPPAPEATVPITPPATAVFEGAEASLIFTAAAANSDMVCPEGGFTTPTIPSEQWNVFEQ